MPTKTYVVSACLAGMNCRYDGKNNAHEGVMNLVRQGRAILVCPEQLGGMATPRAASEILASPSLDGVRDTRRQVVQKCDDKASDLQETTNASYNNVTGEFYHGAQEALNIAKLAGCTHAVLKAKSPSCGCGVIYDGTFTKTKVAGNGIFAQAALDAGIMVWTEENWTEENWPKEKYTDEDCAEKR